MLDLINTMLTPYISEIIGAIVTALIGYVVTLIKAKTGIEIEAKHREALHSALTTGALLALSRLGIGASKADLATAAVDYAKASVPDALAKLSPSADTLTDLALSKVQATLGR